MQYDVVLIGSGPLHVIEAVWLGRQGFSVLILEREKNPFGAWKTVPHELFGQVEMGCHIMERYSGVYKFLSDFLKLEMRRMNPAPVIIRNGKKLPYDWKWNKIVAQSFVNHSKRFNLLKFMHEVNKNRWKIHFCSGIYRYPVGGSAALEESLNNLLIHENILLRKETIVSQLRRANNSWEVITDKGIVRANDVYLSTLSDLESIQTPENSLFPEYISRNYHHFHFLAEGNFAQPFEYLRIINNHIVHRISDITNQLKNELPKNQKLILVGVLDAQSNPFDVSNVFHETSKILQNATYAASMKLLHWQENSYSCKYLSANSITTIQAMDNIRHLASTNLTLSFYHRLKDWNKMLNP